MEPEVSYYYTNNPRRSRQRIRAICKKYPELKAFVVRVVAMSATVVIVNTNEDAADKLAVMSLLKTKYQGIHLNNFPLKRRLDHA